MTATAIWKDISDGPILIIELVQGLVLRRYRSVVAVHPLCYSIVAGLEGQLPFWKACSSGQHLGVSAFSKGTPFKLIKWSYRRPLVVSRG